MGEVYRATDTKLGREVALKVLPAAMAEDAERLERFKREAQTIASLNHPNIVTIHSVEEVDGRHFLTMELVEGETLDGHAGSGPIPLPRLLALVTGILAASLFSALAAVTGESDVYIINLRSVIFETLIGGQAAPPTIHEGKLSLVDTIAIKGVGKFLIYQRRP